ncbi:Isochorismatase hydrolase [Cylindrobasidium torrendii FP15055 ss-10]|uniref:nicotinamidase n=1 Tax=Cylindrobasidium torrendii FP15055 ss-10 TaxID=1314674 RepID=A0A0D7AUF5_9AGAR|nr:Isochorismatase hydrolase [Cylindrobasidium torrendii FP15055 ss-10]
MASHPPNFKPALLVIDMQNDFCPPDGSLAVTGGRDIIPFINELISAPKFIVRLATKDWHPPDHVSFASNHPAPDNHPFTSFATVAHPERDGEAYETRLWPVHCVQGTHGAELVEGLDEVDRVIEKGQDRRLEMYSVFYDPFKVSDSGTAKALKDAGVTWVYVVGLAYDYCVKASALDARSEGFEVVVVRDGSKAVDPSEENIKTVEAEFLSQGIHVVSKEDDRVKWLW